MPNLTRTTYPDGSVREHNGFIDDVVLWDITKKWHAKNEAKRNKPLKIVAWVKRKVNKSKSA